MNNNNVTIFKDFNTPTPSINTIEATLDGIRSGGRIKSLLLKIRELPKEEYDREKKKLPMILFNGEFSHRSKLGFQKGSGLIVLDFDDLEDPVEKRKELINNPNIYSVFTSVNGRDLKALLRVKDTIEDDWEYKCYFNQILKDFKGVDPSGKDISRACFACYDPDIYINQEATEYKLRREDFKVKSWEKVNSALRKITDAVDGEKHLVRTKIGYLIGGWVGQNHLEETEAIQLLLSAVKQNTNNYEAAKKTVLECFQAGKNRPLDLHQEKAYLSMRTGIGKVYYTAEEVDEQLDEFLKSGYQKGMRTGLKSVDEIYSAPEGSTTYFYGFPADGKSQVVHQILCNFATEYNKKIAIFTPETGMVHEVYAEILSILTEQSLIGKGVDPLTLKTAKEFMNEHFFIIDPLGKELRLKDIIEQVSIIEQKHDVKIGVICVDPLNAVDLDRKGERDDIAQGKDLDLFLGDAKKHNRHNIIVTHVRDIPSVTIKDKSGNITKRYRPIPTPFDTANGQAFYRKGMNMVAIYRPLDSDKNPLENEDGIPYTKNATLFVVQKVKPKGSAELGKAVIYYHKDKSRYYDTNATIVINEEVFKPIEPNTEFEKEEDNPFNN